MRPVKESCLAEEDRMFASGKSRIIGNVAKAFITRGLDEMVGIEKAETKMVLDVVAHQKAKNGKALYEETYKAQEEYWIDQYWEKVWKAFNKDHGLETQDMYKSLEEIKYLREVGDTESEERLKGMLELQLFSAMSEHV